MTHILPLPVFRRAHDGDGAECARQPTRGACTDTPGPGTQCTNNPNVPNNPNNPNNPKIPNTDDFPGPPPLDFCWCPADDCAGSRP